MDFDSLAAAGSMLGSAGVIVIDDSTCMVKVATRIIEFFHHESCGKCTPCREGLNWVVKVLRRVEAGQGAPGDLEQLEALGKGIFGNTFWGDGAAMGLRAALAHFETNSSPISRSGGARFTEGRIGAARNGLASRSMSHGWKSRRALRCCRPPSAGHRHPDLLLSEAAAAGLCRMCLVEIEGQRRLQPSCATAVTDGMVVRTNTPLIEETRSSMLDMLLANHPLDCPICDKGGECELQDMVMAYGPREAGSAIPCSSTPRTSAQPGHHHERQPLHPVPALRPDVRGGRRRGRPGHRRKRHGHRRHRLRGQPRELRPVRQLRRGLPGRRADELPLSLQGAALGSETDTVCPHCGTGCQLTGGRKGEFMRVRSKWEHGVNRETLCVRGRFGLDFVESRDRIKRPMIRRDGALVRCPGTKLGTTCAGACRPSRARLRAGSPRRACPTRCSISSRS